ncbi:hypothetical protein ACLF82_07730, partial [Helicobacter pylori]
GINKYGLSCAGLTQNLLKDIFNNIGLATAKEIDEHIANLDKEEAELKLKEAELKEAELKEAELKE